MAELILINIHNQCVYMLLCGIRKQNGMIKRYDWYSYMFVARAAEAKLTYKYT